MTSDARSRQLAAGTRQADSELARIQSEVERETRQFLEGIRDGALKPLKKALEESADAHAALVEELGLELAAGSEAASSESPESTTEGEPPSPAETEQTQADDHALATYRTRVQGEVLAPLLRATRVRNPWATLSRRWADYEKRLQAVAGRAPVQIERIEPAGLYGPAQDDPGLRATGKAAVRAGRQTVRIVGAPFRVLSRLGGGGGSETERAQVVPMRELARDFLRGSAPGAMRPALEEAWQQLAAPMAALERALSEWNRTIFAIQPSTEGEAGHLDDDLQARIAEIRAEAARDAARLEEAAARAEEARNGAEDEDDGSDEEGAGGDALGGESAVAEGEADAVSADGEDTDLDRTSDNPARDVESDADWESDDDSAITDPASTSADDDSTTEPGQNADEARDADKERLEKARAAVEAIRALHRALTDAAAMASEPVCGETVSRVAQGRTDSLRHAMDRAGGFHAHRSGRAREREFARASEALQVRTESWNRWFDAAAARIRFTHALLEARRRTDLVHDELANGVGREGVLDLVGQWRSARDSLMELHTTASNSKALTEAGIAENPQDAAARIDRWREDATQALTENLIAPLEDRSVFRAVQSVADQAAEELARIPQLLPEKFVLNASQAPGSAIVPTGSTRTVPLQELARETLDAFRVEAVRTSPSPILEVLEEAARRSTEIPEVVDFNLTSARDEILSDEHEEVAHEVRELTLQGLERSAESVEALLRVFPPAWDAFAGGVDQRLPDIFREIHRRAVVEGVVQEQILDLGVLIRRQAKAVAEAARNARDWTAARFRLARRWLSPRVRGLLRMSQMAVGAGGEGQEEERALEVIRGIPDLVSGLPLVYRRLFAFQPVQDASLLAGRKAEREWISKRWSGWQAGRPLPGLLIAPPGAGVTSLFNVLEQELFAETRVGRVEVDDRIEDEPQAAALLGEALGIGADTETLDALADRIFEADEDSCAQVFLLEGMEYFQSRTVDGSELLSRLISFQARVASRVFWLSAIGEAGWSLLSTCRPTATTLVATRTVPLLTRKEMESAILARHRRSGLPLVFQRPQDLNPLRSRKVKRASTPEEAQAELQEDFFDRVHRMSEGSQAMADVIWLRSINLEAEEGRAFVRAPRPVRFAFLEQLTPAIDFALMAFLEHGSLTVEEYGEILRAPSEEVERIFEALRTRLLLQAVEDEDTIPRPVDHLEPDTTYRVPQILGVAVANRLRSLNILH